MRRQVIPLSRRLFQIGMAAVAEVLDGEELSALEYAVLAWLKDDPGIDQSGLASRIGIDRTTTSALVSGLGEKGLVERETNPLDRRAHRLGLTRKGESKRARLHPEVARCQQAIVSVLPHEEQELLLDLLVRVVSANEMYVRPGAGRRKPRPRAKQNEGGRNV